MAKIMKKRFFEVDIPLIKTKAEILGKEIESLNNKTIKIDMSRKLRGKSTEAVFQIKVDKDKAIAYPKRLKLMPYFIRRMLRKNISYIEDSINAQSKESKLKIKPFLITRKKVSRVVRKTLRNTARNWIMDYVKDKTNDQIFQDILANTMQKPLSIKLKKTYPLSLCEIRILEVGKPLEVKIKAKPKKEAKAEEEVEEIKEEEVKEKKAEVKEKPVKKKAETKPKKEVEEKTKEEK